MGRRMAFAQEYTANALHSMQGLRYGATKFQAHKYFSALRPVYPATFSGAGAHNPAAHCTASIIAGIPMQEFSSM